MFVYFMNNLMMMRIKKLETISKFSRDKISNSVGQLEMENLVKKRKILLKSDGKQDNWIQK